MTAELPHWFIAGAQFAGALSAFLIAAAVIARSPLGKALTWLWRRIFGEPVAAFANRVVVAAVEPHFKELRAENTAQHKENAEVLRACEARITGRIDVVGSQLETHIRDGHHTATMAAVAAITQAAAQEVSKTEPKGT